MRPKPADTPPATVPQSRALAPHELLLHPEAQGALRMLAWGKFAGDADVSVLVHKMFDATREVKAGNLGMLERMLAAQAISLDTMFTDLAWRALARGAAADSNTHRPGLQSAGAVSGDHRSTGRDQEPEAGCVREAGQHRAPAAGEQWRCGIASTGTGPALAPCTGCAGGHMDSGKGSSTSAARARKSRSQQSRVTQCLRSGHPNVARSRPSMRARSNRGCIALGRVRRKARRSARATPTKAATGAPSATCTSC